MIDRLVLSMALIATGWDGLYPDPPTLKQKAKERSISAMCAKKKQSPQAKEICRKWSQQHA